MGYAFGLLMLTTTMPLTGDEQQRARMDVLMGLLVLFGLVLVVGTVVMWLRHVYLQRGKDEAQDEGFTLADLRALRDRGDLTANEYEVAKNKLLAAYKTKEASTDRRRDAGNGGIEEWNRS